MNNKTIGQMADELVSDSKLTNLSISVVSPKGRCLPIIHRHATDNTYYHFASVGKTFVATAAMKLASECRLDLNSSITNHICTKVPAWEPITILQLLTHSAKLLDYMDYKPRKRRIEAACKLLALIEGKDEIGVMDSQFASLTTSVKYCNTCYLLLGQVITRASEMPWNNYIQQEIFAPAEMKTVREISPLFADGSWGGTIIDLENWALALYRDAPLIPKQCQDKMWFPETKV